MPIKKGSRLWDPSRRVPSTHRASPVRTFVYEQLGLSKPGFWADWRKRTIEGPEPEGYQEEEAPEVSQGPTQYAPVKFHGDEPTAKKQFKNTEFQQEASTEVQKKNLKIGGPLAALMNKQSQTWFKENTLLSGFAMSAMGVMGAEKAIQNQQAAAFLRDKGQGEISYEGVKSLTQFYGMKAKERAIARTNRPFGASEPTNFDKMLALFEKQKPIYTAPTYKILTQGTTKLVSQVPNTSIGQLNVSQNGYVTNPTAPQKQARTTISGRLQTAKVNLGGSKPAVSKLKF